MGTTLGCITFLFFCLISHNAIARLCLFFLLRVYFTIFNSFNSSAGKGEFLFPSRMTNGTSGWNRTVATAPICVIVVGLCVFLYVKHNEEAESYHRRLRRFLRGYVDDMDELLPSVDDKGIHHDDYDHVQEESGFSMKYPHIPNLNGRLLKLYGEQIKEWEKLSRKSFWKYEDEERINWLEQSIANENVRAIMTREAALAKAHDQITKEFNWSTKQ